MGISQLFRLGHEGEATENFGIMKILSISENGVTCAKKLSQEE